MENLNLNLKPLFKSADFNSFTAVIMEPNVVDLHGDIVSSEVIKKTAHNYLKDQKMQSKVQHKITTKDFCLVESYLLNEDKEFNYTMVKKGAWIGEFEVLSEELKQKIKQGDFQGMSIGAQAVVEDLDLHKSIENPFKDNPKRRIQDITQLNEISLVDYPANNQTILSLNKGAQKMEQETIEILKSSLKEKEDRLAILEKAHEEILQKEFISKVVEIKKYVKVDENLTQSLMTISKSCPQEYLKIEKTLFDCLDTIKKSELMVSKGVDNPLDLSKQSGFENIENIAKSLMSVDKRITKEQAIAKVYKQKLYQTEE